MIPPPPPGQGPIDPRGAFSPPPPPQGSMPAQQPQVHPQQMMYPPMPMMPPPMYYPPPPQQRGGSFARAIFMTLATSIFGLSLALNAYLLLAAGIAGAGDRIDQQSLVTGNLGEKIAVIPVTGVIDEFTYKRFEKLIRHAEEDSSVKALVVEVDTPGGGVTASDEIYTRIREFKTKRGVPIVIAMGSMATSGGYYISCAGDEIYAQPTTITGNIGVVLFRMNIAEMLDKWGIKETSVTPEASNYKNLESIFKPETPETTAYLRGLADDMYARFKTIVKESRGSKLAAPMEQVANGKAYTATEALQMKLIDKVGYTPDACTRAAQLAGLSKPSVVRYQPQSGIFSTFFESSFGRANGSGVNIHIDGAMIQDAARPRLMYLWQGK